MSQLDWNTFAGVVSSVVLGALLGYGFTILREHQERRRRCRANAAGLTAEIKMCGEHAAGFLHDNVMAPSYRLPIIFFKRALPSLIVDGALPPDGVAAILHFYNQVETLNRGLDFAHEARIANDEERLKQEDSRNRQHKAPMIAVPNGQFYISASAAVALITRNAWADIERSWGVSGRTYFVVASILFTVVALAHLARLVFSLPVVIGTWSAPLWISWGGLIVTGALAAWGFKLALGRRE